MEMLQSNYTESHPVVVYDGGLSHGSSDESGPESEKKGHLSGERTDEAQMQEEILNMLMIVSHDLRSPLFSIASTLKLLTREVYGKMDESVKEALQALHERVAKLLGTAENCLGKAAAAAGALHVESEILDLKKDIIGPVLEELADETERQRVLVRDKLNANGSGSIRINGDKLWLQNVYRNLFHNAIKHGSKKCTIAFGYWTSAQYHFFNVFNTGAAIPEHVQRKLFTKFCHSSSDPKVSRSERRSRDGVGLGLYLVKKILRMHGGDIWYEAKENGSNFVFTLPRDN